MQAVILAGGKGARLAPYTTQFPKPLMPIGDFGPILEVIIYQLRSCGFTKIEIATGYLAGLIEAYFGDGSRWEVNIRYHVEKTPAGTAGPIYLLRDFLEESFIIMNGDVLTDLSFTELFAAHNAAPSILTIATCQRDTTLPLGAILRDTAGQVCDYVEKPTYHFECSSGIYAADKAIVSYLGGKLPIDLPALVKNLIAQKAHIQAFPISGYWLDIGTPDDYRLANEQFARSLRF